MDRRQVLGGSLLVPAALAAGVAEARATGLRQRLLGSWRLIEPVTVDKATGQTSLWNGRPGPYTGMIVYLANGMMSVHIGSARAATTTPWESLTDAERCTAANTWYGYFGRYELDEAKSQVRHILTGSLQPDETGRTLVRNLKLDGNQLTITTVVPPEAKTYNRLTWERI